MTAALQAEAVARWAQGRVTQGNGDTGFTGVSIDTRSLEPRQLFFAIHGPNHDAHNFLEQAVGAGAIGLVVEKERALPPTLKPEVVVIEVDDTTRALGEVAAGHRSLFEGPLVAVTGSNGKTTSKEMCAAILSRRGPCLRSRGNLNNAYGLPLSLLSRRDEHQSVVVEIGMNHRGEIAALAAIARPTVGIITNVGTAHIEHLGSQEEIALEKGDLVANLSEDAVAVLNADDPRVAAQADRTRARLCQFGLAESADVRATNVTRVNSEGFTFELHYQGESRSVEVAGLATASVSNALAASAGAICAGATLDDVVAGLAAYQPIGGRMQRLRLESDITVINDAYNANPQSMEMALGGLAELKGDARGIAVLGDMGELGDTTRDAHRGVGRRVAELGLDRLCVLGEHADEIAAGARDAGFEANRIHVANDHADAVRELRSWIHAGDWVLVKGSRAARMERVVEELCTGSEAA